MTNMPKFFRPEIINLKDHPEISEKLIQDKIAEDPSILGLGDLILKDKERNQPRAGRLDLLLVDPELDKRYEVEIQLGKTDESHIIRTIEYWDIERKRYPQYDHCAVIIAEDITGRFLNVISLFNGFIPLIALQLKAVKFEDKVALIFTRVLDEMSLGFEDDDKDVNTNLTTREFWSETKSSGKSLQIADKLKDIINEFIPDCKLEYYKANIRIKRENETLPYVILKPRKKYLVLIIKSPKNEKIDSLIEDNDLDAMEYMTRGMKYRFRINDEEIDTKRNAFREILSIIFSNNEDY